MRRFSFVTAAAITVLGTACAAAPAPPPIAAASTIALDPGWPDALPAAVLAQLDRAATSHRIFALGEGDHFVVEKYAYRLALLRPLVERHGLRHLALEMGASDAARIDRYLATGDEAWLHRVVLYGYAGDTDDERRELAPVASGARRPLDDAWADAERGFFRALRALAPPGTQLHVDGFDFDATPGGGYADARATLAACADTVAGRALLPELTPPRHTSGLAEVVRLTALSARLAFDRAALDAACTPAVTDSVRVTLAQLAFSYHTFFEWHDAAADTSPDAPQHLRRMFDERETHMHAHFRRWQATLPTEARIAILSHDMHVARNSEALRYGLAPHDLPMWASLGTRLERDQPGSLWIAWLLYARGTRYSPAHPDPLTTVELAPDSLEAAFDGAGRCFVALDALPPSSAVDLALPFGTETSNAAGPVRSVTDAIVFLPTAHAPTAAPRR